MCRRPLLHNSYSNIPALTLHTNPYTMKLLRRHCQACHIDVGKTAAFCVPTKKPNVHGHLVVPCVVGCLVRPSGVASLTSIMMFHRHVFHKRSSCASASH